MREALDKYLCDKYPRIFADRHGDMKVTAMVWGFECGDGWFDIINDLCAKLDVLYESASIVIVATQVKEKFGMLSFYFCQKGFDTDEWTEEERVILNDIVDDCVNSAEEYSRRTCEICGKVETKSSGTLHNSGSWIYNMCDECWDGSEQGKNRDFEGPVVHPEIV